MSSATSSKNPRPWILIAAYLIAVVGTSLSFSLFNYFIIQRLSPSAAKWVFQNLSSFNPQSAAFIGLAIWIAARNGFVNITTYVVPGILILVTAGSPAISWIFQRYYFFSYDYFSVYLFNIWYYSISAIVHHVLIFVLICRATGIHLRPVHNQSEPKTLSISLLMGLTVVLAFSLAVDLWSTRQGSSATSFQSTLIALPSMMISTVLSYGTKSILFFVFILLFVPGRANKSIGWLLLGVSILAIIAASFYYYLVLLPEVNRELDNLNRSNGIIMPADAPSIVLLLSHAVIDMVMTFVTVSLFNFTGYRWDRSTKRRETNATAQEQISFADVE